MLFPAMVMAQPETHAVISKNAIADAASEPFKPQRVLIDVRSRHSDGAHDFGTLAGLARERGFDVLGFGEHDRYTIRLGIDPILRLLGYSMEHPSLHETGLDRFFFDLKQVREAFPGMRFMAATESTPGYWWSGLPFRDLTLHNAERHIIALGLKRPAQVEALPSYTLENIRGSTQLSRIFWGVAGLLLFLWLIFTRSRFRRRLAGGMLLVTGGLMLYWWWKPVVDADAAFIHAAQKQGLFVIWTHPGTLSGVRPGPMGVKLDTLPYNDRVFEAPTADAFAAVYGDSDRNTVPGGLWDRFMMDYMKGYRPAPIWGVAAGDYHEEGEANEYLGNFPMDVWSKSPDPDAVLAAMRKGRMTAWRQPPDHNMYFRSLYLQATDGRRLLPGDEASLSGHVELVATLGEWHKKGKPLPRRQPIQAQWVVDGFVVGQVSLAPGGSRTSMPLDLAPGPHVVRLHIPMQRGIRMEANPFLLRVKN
jgi:hypothetical protein